MQREHSYGQSGGFQPQPDSTGFEPVVFKRTESPAQAKGLPHSTFTLQFRDGGSKIFQVPDQPIGIATLLAGAVLLLPATPAAAQPQLNHREQEQFLLTARVVSRAPAKKGVTESMRVTLTDGRLTHDAHVQTVNISEIEFQSDRGRELNFKDSYKYNVAAYRLDKLLGLGLVPVSVRRIILGSHAAVTWWVDDVLGDERDRQKGKFQPPDVAAYNLQLYAHRVFTQLIYNTDANTGNFLTDKHYDLWLIDFTRAFREHDTLRDPQSLVLCDRRLLANMRKLNTEILQREMSDVLTKREIEGLLARRNLIVKYFDDKIAEKGETAVLYDMPRYRARPEDQK